MKTKHTIIAIVFLTVVALPSVARGQERTYISQSYIDTTVMRAVLILNEATAHYSPSNDRQSTAVRRAREVLDNLKKQMKGDPNERYALVKIQEVEALIFLEEEELRKIAEDRRILTSNELVRQYNAEAGKLRPDFATLRGIHMRMTEVDPRQANVMAGLYERRRRQLSREVPFSLEKALASNDAFIAKQDLEYCERNRLYLGIHPAQLERQRAQFERLHNSQSDVPRIRAALDEGERALVERRLSESRTSLVMAQNRINEGRSFMTAAVGTELAARSAALLRRLDALEDSLVKVAIGVLERDGPDAAYVYLQEEMQKKYNISRERAAFIDQAIINRSPERVVETANKVEMVEVPSTAVSAQDFEVFRDMQNKARQRAQERADSIRTEKERAGGISVNIYTLLERNKIKDAQAAFDRDKEFLASAMDPGAFEMLEMSVNYAVSTPARETRRQEQRARREEKERERQAKIEAREQERADMVEARERARLERNDRKELARQEKADRKEQARLAKRGRDSRSPAADVAAAPPNSSTTTAAPPEITVAVVAAPQPAPASAASESGWIMPEPVSDSNRQMAIDISSRIYALIERNEIAEAYSRFQRYKTPLQKYMSAAEFEMLELTVVESYNDIAR